MEITNWIILVASCILLLFFIINIIFSSLRKKYGTPYRVLLLQNRYNVLETYYCQTEEKANAIYSQLQDKIVFEETLSVRKQKISIIQYISSTK